MKRSLSAAALLLTLCLLAATLCACGTVGVYASPNAGRKVARVGEEKIPYEALYYLAMNRQDELKATYGETALQDAAIRAEYETYVWENLVDRNVALRSLGAEYGLDVTKGDIADSVNTAVEQIIETEYDGDTDAYVAMLDQVYLTDRYLRVLIGTEEYLPSALIVEMLKTGAMDDSDATAEALIASDALLHTYHVFISRDNGRADADNRAKIAEIRETVAAGATPQERMAAMREAIGSPYNNDYGDTTGSGYYFAVGEFDAAYEQAALALEENCAVSPVVETTAGYYVILRCAKDADYINAHFQNFKEKFYFIRLNELVEQRRSTLTLEKTGLGARLDLCDLTPVRAGGGRGTIIASVAVGIGVVAVAATVIAVQWHKRRKGSAPPSKKKERKHKR